MILFEENDKSFCIHLLTYRLQLTKHEELGVMVKRITSCILFFFYEF